MSNDIKNDLINWNVEQLSDDSPVYNSKDLINALNSIMPSLGSAILATNNHVLSKKEDWDSLMVNTINMFTTLDSSGLPASDFPNNSGILLVLGYTSYNIYIAISGEAVYYRLGGANWNKLLTSKNITDSVATIMDTLGKLSDQQTTLSSLFNTFKDGTTKQLLALTGTVDNTGLISAPAFQSLQTQVDNSAVGTNLIQMSNTTAGYVNEKGAINNADSTLEIVTDFIEVEPNKNYCMQEKIYLRTGQYLWFSVGTYDGNKTFISQITGQKSSATSDGVAFQKWTIEIPENTKYVRVSFVTYGDKNSRFKFEKGSLATDWCPNPAEILTQADYAKIQAAIVALGGSLS